MPQQGSDDLIPAELRPQLLPIARKVFWWGTPEEWVADGRRFLAQVMTYADWDTARATLALVGEGAFKRALENAPAGVFDARSWNYWHLVLKMTPVPPLPERKL